MSSQSEAATVWSEAVPQPTPKPSRRASIVNRYVLGRMMHKDRMGRVLRERLTEPVHLNVLSLFVALFGSFRAKVDFDLIIRQQFAFSILYAADQARALGVKKIVLVEFGVANGSGLLNMCAIAASVTKATGVEFEVYGFDTGAGMPPAIDYRDHPEIFQQGDFPMNFPKLKAALPPFAHLLIGELENTIPAFLQQLSPETPLAFVSLDVDYYSSSKRALEVFKAAPEKYLPMVILYLDDIFNDSCNPWCGENLAVREFNDESTLRKIAPFPFLRARRIFQRARWVDQIYFVHMFDHETRTPKIRREVYAIPNEYISL
jgi:hypothetical protein